MGILNVTPDSFSDGGRFTDVGAAVEHALRMIAEGAVVIDVGGESTRPGAEPVGEEEQLRRVLPVIRALRAADGDAAISIDTRSARVAEAAIGAGADVINDVSALGDDPEMARVAAQSGANVILMHRRGTPADMQRDGGPYYADVAGEVLAYLVERAAWTEAQGVARERILIDPGLGFGKRHEHNLQLMAALPRFAATGLPVVVGASRKRFIGTVTGEENAGARLYGSLACAASAAWSRAALIRAHDVGPTVQVVRMIGAIAEAVR
ncbi:MAG: Dihydropteroate synthase [Phycisphaerae bacterium]|nr:Dihydropteroate synthase [Phycisphaerae bacterium]